MDFPLLSRGSSDPLKPGVRLNDGQSFKGFQLAADHSQSPLLQDSDNDDRDDPALMELTMHFHGKPTQLQVPDDMTLAQLSAAIVESLAIEESKQKIMITPKPGLLKPPFDDSLIRNIITAQSKVTLFGTTNQEIKDLNVSIGKMRVGRSQRNATLPSRHRDWKRVQEEAAFTFHSIQPLSFLPSPERSQRFLERLAGDPGIKASMRKHKFRVGLLTEMNPVEHTTQNSRTLGLNRNRGEVIELRLRTDRYDGYRDYRVIRKTLCHELTHNVWGEHNQNFWALCKEIEEEVDRADWKHGGHLLANDEFYNPNDHVNDQTHADEGGWTGGEFVLGSESSSGNNGLSRREILANAAINRAKKQEIAQAEISRREQQDKDRDEKQP